MRLNEVNAVFLQIDLALGLVEVGFRIGIKNIPSRQIVKPLIFSFLVVEQPVE